MRITALAPKLAFVGTLIAAIAVLAVSVALVDPAAAQLVNPGFDSGPTGPVGNFGAVVGPPFQCCFWGAEAADILAANPCFGARSNPYFLQMNNSGDVLSQAWQAVDVSTGPPVNVTFSAWANTCPGGGTALTAREGVPRALSDNALRDFRLFLRRQDNLIEVALKCGRPAGDVGARDVDGFFFVAGVEGRDEVAQVLWKARLEDPQGRKAIDDVAATTPWRRSIRAASR